MAYIILLFIFSACFQSKTVIISIQHIVCNMERVKTQHQHFTITAARGRQEETAPSLIPWHAMLCCAPTNTTLLFIEMSSIYYTLRVPAPYILYYLYDDGASGPPPRGMVQQTQKTFDIFTCTSTTTTMTTTTRPRTNHVLSILHTRVTHFLARRGGFSANPPGSVLRE